MRRGPIVATGVMVALILALPHQAPTASATPRPPIVVERSGDLFVLELPHHLRRLTETPRRERSPAWSPDRRRVAFVVYERRLVWLDVATGERHRVVRVADRFERIDALTWSPDGTRIAFSTHSLTGRGPRLCGQVWSVAANGGTPRRVLGGQAGVSGLAWGPGGHRLLASTEWPNGIYVCNAQAETGVLRFRADGSHLHVIASTTASNLDLSEDGRRIVYRGWLRTCHACGEIWTSMVDGSRAHVISLPTSAMQGLYGPRFDPDRERVAMLAFRHGHQALWIMHADGSHRHVVLGRAEGLDW